MSETSGLAHQDWETLYIHCKTRTPNDKSNVSVKKTNHNNKESMMEKKIEEGTMKHKKVSNDLKTEFQKWRQSKGMTQKEVAVKLAVNYQVINKFESGNMNHDPKLVGKIKRLIKN